jgi:hypothetical protein
MMSADSKMMPMKNNRKSRTFLLCPAFAPAADEISIGDIA